MSDHLIAEANRHTKALPKMTLPTTKPNDLDLLWYKHECERLQVRNEVLECENAALREDKERLDWIAKNRSVSVTERPLAVTPDSLRAAIDAARKEAQQHFNRTR